MFSTEIVSNGSKWAGDELDTLDQLLDVLVTHTLHPMFEEFGNFIIEADPVLEPGTVQFHGNFWEVSHVFDIRTNDPALIEPLTTAIRANQQRAAYQVAREEEAARLATIARLQAEKDAARDAARMQQALATIAAHR